MTKFLNSGDFQMASLGQYGARTLVTGTATTPTAQVFCALQALTEAIVTANESGSNANADTSFTTITIPAGAIIVGTFTDVDIPSGTGVVRAYFKGR